MSAAVAENTDTGGRARHLMRWWKAVAAGASLCVVAGLLYATISVYAALTLSHFDRVAIRDLPSDLDLAYEDVSFRSRVDGLLLRGWFLPTDPVQDVIVLVHGRGNHRADPEIGLLPLARDLTQHGYSVLMFDMRAHGTSEGDRFSLGDLERRDLEGALDYIEGLDVSPEHVGVLGFSTGGTVALLVAAERPDLRAVVSDSAFADLRSMVNKEWPSETFLPSFFIPGTVLAGRLFLGIDVDAVSPVSVVDRIAPRRVFFIHGLRDTLVPPDNAQKLYTAANNPKNYIWMVEGAGHVGAYKSRGTEYVSRVLDYFDRELRR